jgi:hypothetical protein
MKDMTTKIQNWFMENEPSDVMNYHKAWWNNNVFIRDRIVEELFNSKEAEVIGTHYSKGIVCPVIKTVYKEVEIIWQYNFYDWQIMIKSPVELKLFNLKLYKADGDYLYYQGIPEEYQFEKYSKTNNKEFAIDIYGDQLDVYAFATSLKIAIDKSRWEK